MRGASCQRPSGAYTFGQCSWSVRAVSMITSQRAAQGRYRAYRRRTGLGPGGLRLWMAAGCGRRTRHRGTGRLVQQAPPTAGSETSRPTSTRPPTPLNSSPDPRLESTHRASTDPVTVHIATLRLSSRMVSCHCQESLPHHCSSSTGDQAASSSRRVITMEVSVAGLPLLPSSRCLMSCSW